MTPRRALASLVLLVALVAGLPALEIREGRVRLVIDERTGRFSLSWLADPAKSTWTPLFYAEETRTTYATVTVDGKAARLGDSAEYRVSVSKDGSGAAVEYRSSILAIRQLFRPVAPAGGASAEGVEISWTIENVGAKDVSVGFRFLLDTSLGERSGAHFELPSSGAVSGELVLDASSPDVRVVSPGSAGASLQVAMAGTRVDRPDAAILANWKRLDDAAWKPEASPGRSFTLLPYSINDSALALYWEAKALRRGESRTIRTALGAGAGADYGGMPAGSASSILPPLGPGADRQAALRADLAAVRGLLADLDAQLARPEPDVAAVERIVAMLERLRARRSEY